MLEASGGYEAALLERLLAKQLPVALLNPRHVRQFARTSGRLAKTDAIDAAVLAHFAEVMKPEPRRIGDADTRRLRVLVARRSQLVQMVTAEQHRQSHSPALLHGGFAATIRCFKKQIASIDKQLAALIQQIPALRAKAELLRTTPGIGAVASATLLARLPELGTLDQKQDRRLGWRRSVQSQQRKVERKARDMGRTQRCPQCALHERNRGGAAKCSAPRLLPALMFGRQNAKMALTACMRKLVVILNAILKNATPWQEETPPGVIS